VRKVAISRTTCLPIATNARNLLLYNILEDMVRLIKEMTQNTKKAAESQVLPGGTGLTGKDAPPYCGLAFANRFARVLALGERPNEGVC
jgi:hypothetical protein